MTNETKRPIFLGVLLFVVGLPLALHALIFFLFIYPEREQLGDAVTLILGAAPVIIAAGVVCFMVVRRPKTM